MNKNNSRDWKTARHAAILEAVTHEKISTQNELSRRLKKRGVSATQVSISRDIAELGLIKTGGIYRTGTVGVGASDSEMPLRTFVRRVTAAGPNLTVVSCETGTAQRVGLALDALPIEGLAGTLAGDDAVFVASKNAASQRRLIDFLESRINRP